MQKKTSKMIAMSIAIMVFMSIFTACAGAQGADPQPATTVETSDPVKTDTANTDAPAARAELSVLLPENPTWKINPDSEFFRIVQEKTNTKLNIQTISDADYTEKRNIMISGGTVPDIMYIGSANDVLKFAGQGVLLALDEYIDKNAPNIAKYFTPEERKKVQYTNGKVYSLPRFYDRTIQYYGWMARKDILDANSIAVPNNLDEFYNMLKTLKQKYPDIYPLCLRNAVNDELAMYRVFKGLFGEDNIGYPNYHFFRDGKWKISGMEESSRQALMFLNKLYKEKLIDPEFSIISTQQWEEKMSTGKAFVTHDYMLRAEFFNNAVQKENPEFNLDIIPIPQNEDIIPSQWVPDKLVDWAQFVISAKTKDPVAAISLMDFFYAPEGVDLTNWGMEGKTYEIKNNQKTYLSGVITASNPNGTVDIKKDYLVQYVFMCMVDAESFKQLNLGKNSAVGFDLYEKKNFNMKIAPYVTSAFTQEDSDRVTQIKPLIEKQIVENFSKFIMGGRSFNEWEKFQNELKQNGIEELLQIYQNAYEKKYGK